MKSKETKETNITLSLDSARNFINDRAKIDISTTKEISVDADPLKFPEGVDLNKYYYSWCEESAFPKWNLNPLFVPVTPQNHPKISKENFNLDSNYIINLRGGMLFFALREKIMQIKKLARDQYEEQAKRASQIIEVKTSDGLTVGAELKEQSKAGIAYVQGDKE